MISIICVYNDKKVFNRYLQASLKRQTEDYELVALNNSQNQFSSAAQALNAGAAQTIASSKYLMFVHQDIDLRDSEWLAKAEKILDAIPTLGIAGAAGTPKQNGVLLTNITHGPKKSVPGKYTLQTPIPVHTLDECLVIIPRAVFEKAQFDEQTCDAWHAYVVDYCLEMHQLSLGVFVLPLNLHHGSLGSRNRSYYQALKKVLLKHRSFYSIIYTTCGHWRTRIPLSFQVLWFFLHTWIDLFLKKLITLELVPEWLLRIQRKRQEWRRRSFQLTNIKTTMATEPRVAVIILNWNGFNDTVECLNSINKVSYSNFKTILVDNGSDKNEGLRLKEIFSEIHLISNLTNRGFAGGNNDAINWALNNDFDYIVNLNNDCIVEHDWLSKLVLGIRFAEADFGSSRIMYYPETDRICSDGDALKPDGTGIVINHLMPYNGDSTIKPILSACGAGSIYSIKCLENIKVRGNQFFDELYFAYYEDVDLGIRLNALSYKGVSVPEAVIYHKGTQSAGFRSDFQMFHLEKNRILNEILNYPLWLIVLGETYYVLKTVLCLSKQLIKKQKRNNEIRQAPKTRRVQLIKTFIKSRFWILQNAADILRDRQERKAKQMINSGVYSHFHW